MKEIKICDKFDPLFENFGSKKYYHLYGGRASGKTFSSHIAFVEYLDKNANSTVLSFNKVNSEYYFKEALFRLGINDRFTFSVSQRCFTHKENGSRFLLRGFSTNINQYNADFLFFEDVEEISAKKFIDNIDEIRFGSVVFNYNTPPLTIDKNFFVDGSPNKFISDAIYIKTDFRDNVNNLNKKLTEQFNNLKKTNPTHYKNVILGNFKNK